MIKCNVLITRLLQMQAMMFRFFILKNVNKMLVSYIYFCLIALLDYFCACKTFDDIHDEVTEITDVLFQDLKPSNLAVDENCDLKVN